MPIMEPGIHKRQISIADGYTLLLGNPTADCVSLQAVLIPDYQSLILGAVSGHLTSSGHFRCLASSKTLFLH